MKIGLVCPYNIYKGGGVQECVLALQAELKKRGYEAVVITPRPNDAPTKELEDVIQVGLARDVKSPFATTAQISVSVRNDELDKLLKENDFDVLHFHEPWVPILSWQILAKSGAKNVATFHAKMPETVMSKTIEKVITPYTKSIMKYLSALTAVSVAAAEYSQSLTTKKVQIVPNGIDLSKYKKSSHKTKESKTILFIGRLEKRKGVKYLLSAFGELQKDDDELRLILIGDGPDKMALEAEAKQRGLKNVEFLGYVDEAKKLELISKASVMTSPALYGESFGIVLLEAMAAGTPIVAGDNPGYSSVMRGFGEMSLVDPKDTKTYAGRLRHLLSDDKTRTKWLEWAESYVAQFGYPKIVDQYEKIYSEVMRK